MKIFDVVQKTDAWLELHDKHFSASLASMMMGASKKVSRSELLRMKATGSEQEFSDWVRENLLERGHDIEAAARPLAEDFIGEDLSPVTATDDAEELLASFDGLTLMEDIGWECKSWNEAKAEAVADGRVPDEDLWQVVQQASIIGEGGSVLYTLSDGTPQKTAHVWYHYDAADEAELRAGWKQFSDDLANYQHVEDAPRPEGQAPETLPALHIELTGMVTASNLVQFKEAAMDIIGAVNTNLQTDQDFADAEKAVKWAKEVEVRLDAAKDHALGQTQSIDALFRAIDEIRELARSKRLTLERMVKDRKQSIRGEILQGGKDALAAHIAALNTRIGFPYMPDVAADFAGAMKNKRTVASLRDAVDTVLAKAKIEANKTADRISMNLKLLQDRAKDHKALFADVRVLVLKETEDLESTIKARILEHEQAEQKRRDEERQRIEREAEAKAQREAEQRAEYERQRIRDEERAKAQREADEREKIRQKERERAESERAEKAESKRACASEERRERMQAEQEKQGQRGTPAEATNQEALAPIPDRAVTDIVHELAAWSAKWKISDDAMRALFDILERYTEEA